MYIIGTAGHVDHGKTLLIKALTGIDTDRLPEEKKRGLTIDLGFAHFPGKDGEEIGVVDVPGHERFIRNMTAGAWGIDLALLVVAADDGWMYQSENHLNVLAAMGINDIIVVVTKTDIAAAGRVKDVAGFAAAAVEEKTGRQPETIGVSAAEGTGIEELRSLIIEQLAGVGREEGGAPPLMYIDRVFNVKGAGLVVTGSLREGPVSKDDTLLLLPEGREVRVRGLQTYDRETGTAVPACRTAINISGASAEQLSRGHCLTKAGSGFTAEKEAVILMSGRSSGIRNHSETEFAAGTAHSIGTIHFIGNSDCARVVLTDAVALRSGQPLVIIRKGGSRITGSGIVIWKGKTSPEERIKIASAAGSITLPFNGEAEVKLLLTVTGRMKLSRPLRGDESRPKDSVLCGGWLFSTDAFRGLSDKITSLASAPGGIGTAELQSKLNLPDDAVKAVCRRLADEDLVSEKNGILFSGKTGAPDLSPAAKQILSEAEKGGKLGLDLSAVNIPGAKKELRNLTREGLIVPLTDRLFYTAEDFCRLAEKVMEGLEKGETFDIAHTKSRTGLSRKYLIPLLEKMEEKGMVKREDSLRRVL